MLSRAGLISQQMQGQAGHAVADERISWIGFARGMADERMSKFQRGSRLAAVHTRSPQTPERAQPVVDVVKAFCDPENIGPRCVYLLTGTFCVEQSSGKCGEQVHVAA